MSQYISYSSRNSTGGGGGGTVTAVTASSPLASSGGTTPNISLTGAVAIANGGTGQTTAANAINALLPSQATRAGQYLGTNGTVASWSAVVPTGTANTFAGFNSSGNLASAPAITGILSLSGHVFFDPNRTETFPPFAARGFYADSDAINLANTGFVFSSTDTLTDSLTTNLGMITGANLSVAGTSATGGVLFGTGEVLDSGSSANTGAVNVFTGPNGGSGSSGGITILSGQTTSGSSGSLLLSSGNSAASTGSVNINTGSSSGGSSGDLKLSAGPSDGIAFNGEAAFGTAPVSAAAASADSGVVQIASGPVFDVGATGASGAVTIKSGDNSGLGNSGAIVLRTGSIASGTRGKIGLVDGTEGSAGCVWSSIDTAGNGSWRSGLYALDGTTLIFDWPDTAMNDTAGIASADFTARELYNVAGDTVVGWEAKLLNRASGPDKALDWGNSQLINTLATPILDWSAYQVAFIDTQLYSVLDATSAPTVTVSSNAGTSASGSVTSATDIAGVLSLTTGLVSLSSGAQITVNYAAGYPGSTIVTLTPHNATAGTTAVGVYVTSDASGFTVNFATASIAAQTYTWYYHVIGT